MNYFETVGGHELLERCNHSLPKITNALEKIAVGIDIANELKAQEMIAAGQLTQETYLKMKESLKTK